jgi:diguanylate cyclase (GGDEF)-like protein/PAS domain S-box-containing protein
MVDPWSWERTITSVVVSGAGHGAGGLPSDASALLDALADVVMAIDTDARLVYVNQAAEMYGWDRSAWIGRSAFDLIHPDDLAIAASAQETMQSKTIGTPIEIRIIDPRGTWRLFEVVGSNHLDDDLGVMVLACRDISERRRWEVAAGDIPRFQAVVQHSTAITMLVDADGRVHSASAALTRLTGLDPERVLGGRLSLLAAPGHEALLDRVLQRRPGQATTSSVEVPVGLVAGGARPFRFEVVDLRDDPVVQGYVVTAYDVSELHSARDALQQLATHDALTGLPNRIALTNAIGDALVRRGDTDQVGLLFVDLDRFKPVNDLFGHDAGDELLIAVSARLRSLVRSSDTVGRIGGDEFVVLAPGLVSRSSIEELGRRAEQAVAEPFVLRSGVASISASVGVSYSDAASTVGSLLAEADQAMYQIKAARRSGAVPRVRRWTERRELAGMLRGAIERREMVAHLQPVVSVADGTLRGFEALVRWHHPSGRVLGPADFLDVAFEAGVGTQIDRSIADQACGLLARLQPLLPDAWVSVNMSAHDLVDPDIVGMVSDTLTRHGLTPDRLLVEVTEQATLELPGLREQASPQVTLRELAHLGVRIALDDFGTGYSSLTHLRKLKVHTIKIDRSFVNGILTDTTDLNLVSAIVSLAHSLGLHAVAEGVEDREQLLMLRELGCDSAQGYLMSPAIAPDELEAWVSAYVSGVPVA